MFKNKYEADNSRFGEVLTQVLSAHGIGVRHFLAEAKVGIQGFTPSSAARATTG